MNKIVIALILSFGLSGYIFAESSIENDFIYVNKENCEGGQSIKDQKIITERLFGNAVASKMGCNKKTTSYAPFSIPEVYDIFLICKFQKDIKSDDQRCFGLNIWSSFEAGTSIYSPVYGSGFDLNDKPRSSKNIVDGKIVYSSYSFCHSVPLNIEEDWFDVIQSLLIDNGWKIETENNQERSIYKRLIETNPISDFLNAPLIDYGPEQLPEADTNRQKILNTNDPFLFDNKNLNSPKFIRFKKEDIYAEFSWYEKEYREWMHSLFRHDTKTYTFPNAMLFIYDFKKIGRGNLIGPNCRGYIYKNK